MIFLFFLINGLSLGSIYAIIALGYTMVYGIAKMLNFAHGDVIMVGAYIAFCGLQYWGIPPVLAILLAMVFCTLLGVTIEGFAYRPLRQATSLAVLITAIGMSYLLQNIALMIWGANPNFFPTTFINGSNIRLGTLNISSATLFTIAANVIIMRVDGFAMMPNFSFGTALTTYAGQNVGAKRIDRVEQGAKSGTWIAIITSAVITGLIVLFGPWLMSIFTNTQELIDMSASMMRILAVGYIAMAITQSLSGIMRGAGDTMTPMWISLITTVAVRVPLAYLLVYLSKTPELPDGHYSGIFISLLICWLIGAVLTFIAYKRGRWKEKGLN